MGAWPEPLRVDAGEGEAQKAQHREPGGLAEAMNLTVLPLLEHDLEPRLVAVEAQAPHLRRARGAAVYLDALLPAVEVFVLDEATDLRDVHLGRGLARMQQAVRELAVVGQEQGPARVEVEPPDGDDARRHPLHVLGDGGAPLWVFHRGDDVPRLVEHDVDGNLCGDAPAVDLDDVSSRIRPGSELRHDLAVHGDSPFGDQEFGVAARCHAGLREELLQAFRGHAGALSKASRFG